MRGISASMAAWSLLLALGADPFVPARAGGEGGWRQARPGHAWSFPRDHWSHPGFRTEWWYLTGHLETDGEPRRRFGFQFTMFRVGVVPEVPAHDSGWSSSGLVMGHMSITDVAGRRHRFGELLYRQTPFLGGFGVHPDPRIAWSRGPAGTEDEWQVRWNGEAFDIEAVDRRQQMGLSLRTRPARPLILHGPGGYSRKGTAGHAASLYYSFTRLATEGEVVLDGTSYSVSGTSWMDKEISSSQLTGDQVGWDWFSLQLEDGRDLMIYVLRDLEGEPDFGRGTMVEAGGEKRDLSPADWQLTALDTWTSPRTGATYPSGWRLRLPRHGVDVRILPVLEDQENSSGLSGGIHYWEGAVDVWTDGDQEAIGRGYVELTGYGEDSRPPI